MDTALNLLTELARKLNGRLSFEETLSEVAAYGSLILGVTRVSLRLLDASRTQLIAVTRAGQPLHDQPLPFEIGEGLLGWIVEHGETLRTGNATEDPRFEPRRGMRRELGSLLGVPLLSGAEATGVLSAASAERDFFDERHEQLAVLLAAIASPWVEVARLSRLSTVDPLTGALNRRGLDESFPEVRNGKGPLSVIMVDLDHFKRVNDTHGHAAGDAVLRAVTTRLAEVLRLGDAVVRYGGEEFLLILPEASLEQATRVATRALESLRASPIRAGDLKLSVTASFGVAQRLEGEDRDQVIERADAAMYRAKAEGRDRVEMAMKAESTTDPVNRR